jgi:hypothetical protein
VYKGKTSNLIGINSLIIIPKLVVLCSYFIWDPSGLVPDRIKGFSSFEIAVGFATGRWARL